MRLLIFAALGLLGQTANGYSHVVVVEPGKLVFISGQVANDEKGQLVGNGDFKAQAEQVFVNLKAALVSAGGSFGITSRSCCP